MLDMDIPLLLGGFFIALLVLIGLPSKNVLELLKRSRSWENEHGSDCCAERLDDNWYWQTDAGKARKLAERRH